VTSHDLNLTEMRQPEDIILH